MAKASLNQGLPRIAQTHCGTTHPTFARMCGWSARRRGRQLWWRPMEPAGYYPCLDNPAFMGMFDLEMSYRMRARTTPRKCCFTGCSLESQAGLT